MAKHIEAISRERVNVIEQTDLVQEVPQALEELEREAKNEEAADHDIVDPAALVRSTDIQAEADETEPSGRQLENVKTVLEEALGHDIEAFKKTDRDPQDVQQSLNQAAREAESQEGKSRVSELKPPGDFLASDSEDEDLRGLANE